MGRRKVKRVQNKKTKNPGKEAATAILDFETKKVHNCFTVLAKHLWGFM